MFHGDRWAQVFVSTLGGNAEVGFPLLKSLVAPLGSIERALCGHSMARKVEKALLASVTESGLAENMKTVAETVVRFVALLVEKGRFKHANRVIEKIEELIDGRNGVLSVSLETAFPLPKDGDGSDGITAAEFERLIAERSGAAKVRMRVRQVPQLLGGYRLKVGSLLVDASLRKQLENMRADLQTAALTMGMDNERL
jgi:F0F1-type ATP synthase delta subunit